MSDSLVDPKGRLWNIQVSVVKDVLYLCPRLKVKPLGKLDVLDERERNRLGSPALQAADSRVSLASDVIPGLDKGSRVQIILRACSVEIGRYAWDAIWPGIAPSA
jgi:hypothetical protein